MALTPCDDATVIDWITQATNVPSTDGTVARLVPSGFEAYAQVLHAIHLEPGVANLEALNFHGDESESWARVQEQLAKFGAKLPAGATSVRSRPGSSIGTRNGRRVMWRELALFLGHALSNPVSFDADLWDFTTGDWPEQLDGPTEGSLTVGECDSLVSAIEAFTDGIVTYWYTWANTGTIQGRCDVGMLSDLSQYFDIDEVRATPEYWWPSDRSWVVHTNIDLSYTLVAGTRALIDALLQHPDLECIELFSDTRLWPPTDHLRQPYSPTPPASPS